MDYTALQKGTAVALGSFDGLHLGHIAVINSAKNMAAQIGATPCISTFSEHPLKVLTGKAPPALFEGAIRDDAFRNTGIDIYRLDFASIMNMSPKEFFDEILQKKMNARAVCCGFNYTFGKKGAGTVETLRQLCSEEGVLLSVSEPATLDGIPVSSTRIREALEAGNPELAARMLGRPFSFRQQVVSGDQRGRTWGIPTINQLYPESLVVPRRGVYASRCIIDGRTYYGATNIGVRPTIGSGEPVSAETNILDYSGDLYGKYVDVCLLRFLRPEKKFDSLDALEAQIHADIEMIRTIGKNDAY